MKFLIISLILVLAACSNQAQTERIKRELAEQDFNKWRTRYVETLGGNPAWVWNLETTYQADVNSVIEGRANRRAAELLEMTYIPRYEASKNKNNVDAVMWRLNQQQFKRRN